LLTFAFQLMAILPDCDSRMIWGILQAINAIADLIPEKIMANLNLLLKATDSSSVIAHDNMMAILARLNGDERFSTTITPVLLQRLTHSAPNQFPTYAELSAATIADENQPQLLKIIQKRLKSIASPIRRKRLLKLEKNLLKKIG